MKKIIWEKWEDYFNKDDGSNNGNKIVVATPIGMISHKISAKSSGDLNFWVGNTDFDLNGLHIGVINNVPGVEMFTLWTPYKFRICVGKAFRTKKVLKDIEVALGCHNHKKSVLLTPAQKLEIYKIKQEISKNKFWGIYILPNGGFEYWGTDNNKQFIETYTFFNAMLNSVGGRLLSPAHDKMVY